MCASCDCKCKTLKIEVGKTYQTHDASTKIKIVHKSSNEKRKWPYLGVEIFSDLSERTLFFKEDGECSSIPSSNSIIKEYKEPTFRYWPIFKMNAGSISGCSGYSSRDEAVKVGQRCSVPNSPFIAIGKVDQDTCEITIEKI